MFFLIFSYPLIWVLSKNVQLFIDHFAKNKRYLLSHACNFVHLHCNWNLNIRLPEARKVIERIWWKLCRLYRCFIFIGEILDLVRTYSTNQRWYKIPQLKLSMFRNSRLLVFYEIWPKRLRQSSSCTNILLVVQYNILVNLITNFNGYYFWFIQWSLHWLIRLHKQISINESQIIMEKVWSIRNWIHFISLILGLNK